MKKFTSLLLVLAMLMSLCATLAIAEEDKPFKGQHFVIWDDYRRYVINSDTGEPSNIMDTSILINAAYEEWALENECTIEIIWGGHDALQGAIDTGAAPLLWNANSNFPQEPLKGLAQPDSAELQAAIAEKYGTGIMKPMTFNNEVYGALYPWVGTGSILYNATKCEELGIKTPMEYYMEGNWTYETYRQFLADCTLDVDGDGNMDYMGHTVLDSGAEQNPPVVFNEEGKLVSTLDSDRQRAWFDSVYSSFTIDGSLRDVNVKLGDSVNGFKDGIQVLMGNLGNWEPWRPDYMVKYGPDGDVIQYCPRPVWKQGDTEQSYTRHVLYMMIPTGCPNVAAAEDLIQYVYDRVMAEVEIMAYGELTGKYTRMTRSTELSKKILDMHDAKVAELAANAEEIGYDADFRAATIEWFFNNNNWHTMIKAPGVTWHLIQDTAFASLYKLPSATSIAQCHAVLQNQCDSFNALYIDGVAE